MKLKIRASRHLKPLFEDKSRVQVIVAHRRFGKTSYALMKIIMDAQNKPKGRYFYISPTFRQSKMIAWNTINNLLPDEVITRRNESELYVELINGAKIELMGGEDIGRLKGVGLDGCVIDEAALCDEHLYTEAIRPALMDKKGWIVFISTPKGKNWFYDLYQMSEIKHLYPVSKTGVITEDELELAKKTMSEDEYRQEMECDFIYSSGQIYRLNPMNVIEPFPLEGTESWNEIIGLDWGIQHHTGILFGKIDYDGKLYVVDELKENGKEVTYYADIIKRRSRQDYSVYISPDTLAKDRFRKGIQYSIFQEFAEQGVPVVVANNHVSAGINLVKQKLASGDLIIFNTCHELLKEMDTYRWKESDDGQDRPVKINDDMVDALRYMVATYFTPTNKPIKKTPMYSAEYFEEMANSQHGKELPSWV